MPLRRGKSRSTWAANYKTERKHGKPKKQAAAIAYAVQRRAKGR